MIRRVAAEGLGTAFLLAAVVGSGIMGEQLSGGNAAIALLANTIATAAALVALILTYGAVSGAHFNPAVTLSLAWSRQFPWRDVPAYLGAQTAGAFCGVAAAHAMFREPLFLASQHVRSGGAQLWSEFVATFGLIGVVRTCPPAFAAFGVGAYIAGAYWFTASTSFANPAVTVARAATNTFAGIRPVDAPGFVIAQLTAAFIATLVFQKLAAVKK